MASRNHNSEHYPEKSIAATLVAIVVVVPAAVVSGIIVYIYTFIFELIIGGEHWIPYFYEVVLMWFPELLRGMVIGAIAVSTSRYFYPNSNVATVQLATLAFWGALMLLLLLFSVSLRGMTSDLIGLIALAIGLAMGLWSSGR